MTKKNEEKSIGGGAVELDEKELDGVQGGNLFEVWPNKIRAAETTDRSREFLSSGHGSGVRKVEGGVRKGGSRT